MLIIVGYQASAEGEAALNAAISEATLRGGSLLVIHSERGGVEFEGRDSLRVDTDLEQVRERLKAAGVEGQVRALVRGSEAADDVVSIAAEQQADLIVIGLRKRTPVGKLILGSTSQRILLEAHCPVLAVKAAH